MANIAKLSGGFFLLCSRRGMEGFAKDFPGEHLIASAAPTAMELCLTGERWRSSFQGVILWFDGEENYGQDNSLHRL